MVRIIVKPNAQNINLSIPAEYIGEEVEILVIPINSMDSSGESSNSEQERLAKKKKAFKNFMKYKGVLPADFDYNKELAEYRDTRYGHID